MKICANCHTENPEEALLCEKCGDDLTIRYIRRHRVRHKHRRSRSMNKKKIGMPAIVLGVLFLLAFVTLIVLMVYHSIVH